MGRETHMPTVKIFPVFFNIYIKINKQIIIK